jgi:hypothetical protein
VWVCGLVLGRLLSGLWLWLGRRVCCAALLLDVRGLWWELRGCKLLYIQEAELNVPLGATVAGREA